MKNKLDHSRVTKEYLRSYEGMQMLPYNNPDGMYYIVKRSDYFDKVKDSYKCYYPRTKDSNGKVMYDNYHDVRFCFGPNQSIMHYNDNINFLVFNTEQGPFFLDETRITSSTIPKSFDNICYHIFAISKLGKVCKYNINDYPIEFTNEDLKYFFKSHFLIRVNDFSIVDIGYSCYNNGIYSSRGKIFFNVDDVKRSTLDDYYFSERIIDKIENFRKQKGDLK